MKATKKRIRDLIHKKPGILTSEILETFDYDVEKVISILHELEDEHCVKTKIHKPFIFFYPS